MSRLPYSKVIARTALYCPYLWNDYKKSTFNKVHVAFNNAYRKIFGLPKRSSASTMYEIHSICNFETTLKKKRHLDSYRGWNRALIL